MPGFKLDDQIVNMRIIGANMSLLITMYMIKLNC